MRINVAEPQTYLQARDIMIIYTHIYHHVRYSDSGTRVLWTTTHSVSREHPLRSRFFVFIVVTIFAFGMYVFTTVSVTSWWPPSWLVHNCFPEDILLFLLWCVIKNANVCPSGTSEIQKAATKHSTTRVNTRLLNFRKFLARYTYMRLWLTIAIWAT